MGEKGWLKTFTADARPGAYLSVVTSGRIKGGDPVRVLHRPDHEVTVSLMFRAFSTEPDLLPQCCRPVPLWRRRPGGTSPRLDRDLSPTQLSSSTISS